MTTPVSPIGVFTVTLATEPTAVSNEQWVHLLPAGRFEGRDGRGPWKVTNPAAVIAATRAYAGKTQLAVDYDHQADYAARNGKPAPAAGWIKGLQARSDGIWGLVNWTQRAAEHLRAKEYRYLSPVMNYTPDGTVTRLLRAALTNAPNLELTALASTRGTMDTCDLTGLRQLLELPDDADIDAITEAVKKLLTTAQSAVDPAHYVPIGDFKRIVSDYNRINQGLSLQAAEQAVERAVACGVLPPSLRDWGIKVCSVNKPVFDDFLKTTGPSIHRIFEPSGLDGPPPGTTRNGRLSQGQVAVCKAMGIFEGDYYKHFED